MGWERLLEVARDPVANIRARVEREGRPLAIAMSSYVPLEVLDAFGCSAVRWGPVCEDFPRADGVMQAYACSFIRSALEMLLSRNLPAGLVATASGCDVLTAVPGMLSVARPDLATAHLRLPIRVDGAPARQQAVRALVAFCEEVRERLGAPLDLNRLDQAARSRQEVRNRIAACFAGLASGMFSAVPAYGAALAAQSMAPEEWLAAFPGASDLPSADGVPVLLSGETVPSLEVIEELQSLGLRIVADDTNTAAREASRRVHLEASDLVEAIAVSLVDRPWHSPERLVPDRPAAVAARAREAEARAAILLHQKFCDPCAFEAPGLAAALREVGIPSLVLELDRQKGLTGGQRTRVQTLLESLP